jgi:acylphosphatase
MKTVHLLIIGKVQGVFYRATANKKALSLGLKGWVKNTSEGNVEAMVYGHEDDVSAFVNWSKIGPNNARVKDVTVTEQPGITFDRFEVKFDA